MANLQLTFASALYDRMQPIYTGEVKPDGIDLNFIRINKKAGISKPKDLEGKRIGVALYTMTAAIFIRGILQHDHGVDFSKVTWVQGAINESGAHGSPTVLPLLKPVKIEQGPPNK